VEIEKYISKNYSNLKNLGELKKKEYLLSEPFPSIILDNFFNEDYLKEILKEFPNLENLENTSKYVNKNEIKFANNNFELFPKILKNFISFLNSQEFINFIQNITSIKEPLKADKDLNGGGLHEIKKGGVLKIHTDFNRHPSLDLDRRVNVLIYLNKDWNDKYGGHLELWDKDMTECKQRILPIFNRMVIFSTNDYSNHGHPNPVTCPIDLSRKSIALYYFSKGRPAEELNRNHLKNKTYFKNRSGIVDDVESKNEKFKNILRNLKIYKYLKRFEKKFLRKKI
jgi:Rps23 Pro-64 3,4-dihydroxylase Tpa1-like proline 4-hydroxylase